MLSLGILLVMVGFILSRAHLFAPLHEFVHVVAGWFTGTKLLAVRWNAVAHEKFVPAVIIAGFSGELAIWTVVILKSRKILVKSFFYGVAIDTMYVGMVSADFNFYLPLAWGHYYASVARKVYGILSLAVLAVLTVALIRAWLKEKKHANKR